MPVCVKEGYGCFCFGLLPYVARVLVQLWMLVFKTVESCMGLRFAVAMQGMLAVFFNPLQIGLTNIIH